MNRPTGKEIAQTVDRLQAELASMLDPMDIPGSWTLRQLDEYEAKRSTLRGSIHVLTYCGQSVAALLPMIEADEKWEAFLVSARAQLCKELLAISSDQREPTTRGRIHALTISIGIIDNNFDFQNQMMPSNLPLDDLMRAAGFEIGGTLASNVGASWRGSMTRVAWRLDEARRELDAHAQRIAAAIQSSAPLLSAEVSS